MLKLERKSSWNPCPCKTTLRSRDQNLMFVSKWNESSLPPQCWSVVRWPRPFQTLRPLQESLTWQYGQCRLSSRLLFFRNICSPVFFPFCFELVTLHCHAIATAMDGHAKIKPGSQEQEHTPMQNWVMVQRSWKSRGDWDRLWVPDFGWKIFYSSLSFFFFFFFSCVQVKLTGC